MLTIVIVLRADYGATIYRSVQRAGGTALGALAVGAFAGQLGHLGAAGLIGVAAVCILCAYALFEVNYLLYSVCLTAFIILLLEMVGTQTRSTAEARLVDTAIGAALGLVAYLMWPTWHRDTAHHTLAGMVGAHSGYVAAMLAELAHPGTSTPEQLRQLQAAARRARWDGEATAQRLADEPTDSRMTLRLVEDLLAAMARFARGELALHALLSLRDNGPSTAGAQSLDALASGLQAALQQMSAALANLHAPRDVSRLHPLQAALCDNWPDGDLLTVSDGLVAAADDMTAVLHRHLPERASGKSLAHAVTVCAPSTP